MARERNRVIGCAQPQMSQKKNAKPNGRMTAKRAIDAMRRRSISSSFGSRRSTFARSFAALLSRYHSAATQHNRQGEADQRALQGHFHGNYPMSMVVICWNRGVAIVGANAAGFTLHLLPAFGTVLAMVFLGEAFRAFHAAGIATILVGVVIFQSLVYLGLRTTTAINAVLLNSSAPLFMLLCSWMIEREHATRRQVAGMLVSLCGILVIVSHGEPQKLLQLEFHAGDAWILLAMPAWGIYSVLLKRRPPELGGLGLLFVISAAVICWNRGVAIVGANAAGFTLHLLPAFGTVLAMVFLGEAFRAFHAAGIATILVGVVLATRAATTSSLR